MRFGKFGMILSLTMTCLQVRAAEVSRCDGPVHKIGELQAKFEKLRYEDDKQRAQGFDTDDAAIQMFDDFRNVKGACRPAVWKALVELARAQVPFDMEAQASEYIVRYSKDQELNRIYGQIINDSRMAKDCRTRLLDSQVSLENCSGKSTTGHEPKSICQEKYSFNYLKCLGLEK